MKKMIIPTIFMAIALAIASFGIKNQQEQIVDFVYERDAKDISQTIYDHWNWILPHHKNIKNRDKILRKELWEKNRAGELHIKVLRNKKRIVGFITFRKKNANRGNIRIIAIAKDVRGKKCERDLIIAVANDLFDAGCTSTYLTTHKNNKKIPTLESLGFEKSEKSQDMLEWFKKASLSADDYPKYVVTKETFTPYAKKINFRIFLSLADYSINFCLYFINSIIRNCGLPTIKNKPSLNFET